MIKETLKQHRKTIIITVVVTILPMFAGIVLWNSLPDVIATHFGVNGEPNGWSSKAFLVFGIPAMLLAFQAICMCLAVFDPKRRYISGKAFDMALWIIPSCSLLTGVISYGYALGPGIRVGTIVNAYLGAVFIVIGRLLPKNGINYTMGVRTPWALNDPENWSRTNKFAGYLFFIGGIVLLITCWLESIWIAISVVALVAVLPLLFSFLWYIKKKNREEY